MNVEQLMLESLQLLGLGMGAVFIILTLLIALISLVAKIVPEEAKPKPASSAQSAADKDHIAVISAALHWYRKHR